MFAHCDRLVKSSYNCFCLRVGGWLMVVGWRFTNHQPLTINN
ncbi:MAG: hypothetical protein ACHBN1_05115 [Heteroscytonema crispum UTEX LB 1556]